MPDAKISDLRSREALTRCLNRHRRSAQPQLVGRVLACGPALNSPRGIAVRRGCSSSRPDNFASEAHRALRWIEDQRKQVPRVVFPRCGRGTSLTARRQGAATSEAHVSARARAVTPRHPLRQYMYD